MPQRRTRHLLPYTEILLILAITLACYSAGHSLGWL